MYQKKLMWLLCATILTSQPVFAQDAAKPEPDSKPPAVAAVEASKPSGFTLDDAIAKALSGSPRLKAFNSGVAAAKGELRQSNAWVNPEVGIEAENVAGKGAYKGFDSAEVTYGVTQELTIGGKISARENNRQMTLNASAELTQVHERMENAYVQAQTLKTEILPSADKAFRLAREGYGLGRFPYLEVLDAQRSLFGVKQQQIEAIREFHTAKAQVERLTATRLSQLQKSGETHE